MPVRAWPTDLQIEPAGVARQGCSNTDGPAVDFLFKVKNALPTVRYELFEGKVMPLVSGPPLVGNQELNLRINATPSEVAKPRQWTVQDPDAGGSLVASVCPAGTARCDSAVEGTMTVERATNGVIAGRLDITFGTGNRLESQFSARLEAPPRTVRCPG